MKFYFCASARGLDSYKAFYKRIVEHGKKLGHASVDDLAVNVNPDMFYSGEYDEQVEHYKKTLKHIKAADIVILEVSTHSLSMGYIMEKALEIGKPVVALHSANAFPYFASGIEDEKLQLIEYSSENLESTLEQAFDFAKDQSDTRFNFFIAPRHVSYLDWVAKTKRLPRSVYLRNLIKEDMEKSREYLG